MISDYEKGLVRIETRTEELFGDVYSMDLSTLPIETLTGIEWWIMQQLNYLYSLSASKEEEWNLLKLSESEYIRERKLIHLKDLKGQGRVAIATEMAEDNAKEYTRNTLEAYNVFNSFRKKIKSAESIQKTVIQTISTVNKEMDRQFFIKGK